MLGGLRAGPPARDVSELSRVLLGLHGHLAAERPAVSGLPRPHHRREPLQRADR